MDSEKYLKKRLIDHIVDSIKFTERAVEQSGTCTYQILTETVDLNISG